MIQNEFVRGSVLGGVAATATPQAWYQLPLNLGAQIPSTIVNSIPQNVIGQWPQAIGNTVQYGQIPCTVVQTTPMSHPQLAMNHPYMYGCNLPINYLHVLPIANQIPHVGTMPTQAFGQTFTPFVTPTINTPWGFYPTICR